MSTWRNDKPATDGWYWCRDVETGSQLHAAEFVDGAWWRPCCMNLADDSCYEWHPQMLNEPEEPK